MISCLLLAFFILEQLPGIIAMPHTFSQPKPPGEALRQVIGRPPPHNRLSSPLQPPTHPSTPLTLTTWTDILSNNSQQPKSARHTQQTHIYKGDKTKKQTHQEAEGRQTNPEKEDFVHRLVSSVRSFVHARGSYHDSMNCPA